MRDQSPHQEFELQANNPTAVILVHGIVGSPCQFRHFTDKLRQQSFDYKALLLPGHGGEARDFYKTPCTVWQKYVDEQICRMKETHDNVYIIGHSLGGLLCLNYASTHDVAGIVLINTPLKFKISIRQLAFSAKILLSDAKRDDDFLTTYRQAFSVANGRLYEYPLWLRQFIGLTGIIRKTRKCLHRVKARTLIIQSVLDESVHHKSVEMLKAGLCSTKTDILRLKDSYHGYFSTADRDTHVDAVIDFLKRNIRSTSIEI